MEKFVGLFAEQFEDTEKSEITTSTVFKDLEEWNSLLALSVIGMVDEEYDVLLKGEEIRTANTVEELFNIVQSKL